MPKIPYPPMPKFSEESATEAACILLQLRGGEMSYLKLLKLLYLAEREFFIKTSSFITNDIPVSMDRGPVLSRIYNLMLEQPEPDMKSYWRKYISPPTLKYTLKLIKGMPERAISDFARDTLKSIYEKFGKMSRWELVKHSHNLPEWKDPKGSSFPIHPREILKHSGKSKEVVDSILELNAHMAWVEKTLT